MGGSVTKQVWDSLPGSNPLRIVMLGLDSAGKTTVLYRLKFDQYVNTVPTVGFNCEKVKGQSGKAKGVSFTIWDVGGQDKIRALWRSYTRSSDGIVFVVDSVDRERMEEARIELQKTSRSAETTGIPILVLANKQDLPGAEALGDMEKRLALHELTANHTWRILPTCAINGEGIDEALDCLYGLIQKRKKAAKSAKKKR